MEHLIENEIRRQLIEAAKKYNQIRRRAKYANERNLLRSYRHQLEAQKVQALQEYLATVEWFLYFRGTQQKTANL